MYQKPSHHSASRMFTHSLFSFQRSNLFSLPKPVRFSNSYIISCPNQLCKLFFQVSFEACFHLLAAPCKLCFLGRNKNIPCIATTCKALFKNIWIIHHSHENMHFRLTLSGIILSTWMTISFHTRLSISELDQLKGSELFHFASHVSNPYIEETKKAKLDVIS